MSTPVTYRELLIDRYKQVHDWVPEGTTRLLDVGCGNALFTQWLQQRAGVVYGVDHNQRNCRRGIAEYPDLKLAASAAEALPFPNETFDCVVCSDTIEHTDDDQRSIDELLRVLKPGGALIVTVPQGGLFGWLDGENLVNGMFETVRRMRVPKPRGGYLLSSFTFRPHRHYTEAKLRAMLGDRVQVRQVAQRGLFLYPFLYLLEKLLESFCGRDLVSADYRSLRLLRGWDYHGSYGALAFNLGVLATKRSDL